MNISIYIKEPLLAKVKKMARENDISLSKLMEKALEKMADNDIPSLPLKHLSTEEGILALGGNAVEDADGYYE